MSYPRPELEEVLGETYGVIVYQEQVMRIARVLAGYTLAGADLLRRAMGKKDAVKMALERGCFLSGAAARWVEAGTASSVFDLMAKFAEYGFNKSHSAAYALIAYRTAYLKAHHFPEFMAALLSCDAGDTDKVVREIADCRTHGVRVLPPDLNGSQKGAVAGHR